MQNLLEIARIEAGELHPVKQWGSIAEIFANVLDRCAMEFSSHKIRVECPESLPMVRVDSRLLASVIANLLENAAKYSPLQSEIVLCGQIKDTHQDQRPGPRARNSSE